MRLFCLFVCRMAGTIYWRTDVCLINGNHLRLTNKMKDNIEIYLRENIEGNVFVNSCLARDTHQNANFIKMTISITYFREGTPYPDFFTFPVSFQ